MSPSVRAGVAAAALSLLLVVPACSSADAARTVEAAHAVELIGAGGHTVLDVRTPAEYAAGHVAGAENVDVSAVAFAEALKELDQDARYVLYCQSGKRAATAVEKMAGLGFTGLVNAGGIAALEAAGAELVPAG